MSDKISKTDAQRQLLTDAQAKGTGATLGAYVKLSGPGWLQSAITLGGGSLAGALFLGVLGGTNLLWLQLVAIVMGVVMLSAISYVTLSTGQKPFQQINQHINPVLGWGWLAATILANMLWCMPQFSLCFAALQKNLVGDSVGDGIGTKLTVSLVILVAAVCAVLVNSKQGAAAKVFDYFLKALVGMIVICFFGVVVYLSKEGLLDWGNIFSGFIPNLKQWSEPSGEVGAIVQTLSPKIGEFWSATIIKEQRAVMIGAAATAVGINMTFLMPYSMLNRGWDKPFRGLARFDLATGMAIPYVLVTSCVVIAAAASFHAKVDDNFASTDPAVMQQSDLYGGAQQIMAARIEHELGAEAYAALSEDEKLSKMASLSLEEKKIVSSLVKRNAFQLSQSLAPILGEDNAKLVFGIGIFGMGFSTIMILMLINGFAFCEMLGKPQGGVPFAIGCLAAGISGAAWPMIWDGPAKLWLAILVSSFGMILLPIAYFTFFMMMNSRSILGDEKPTGGKMIVWNVLMGVSVLGACAAAYTAVVAKASDPKVGPAVIAMTVIFLIAVGIGFFLKPKQQPAESK